MIDIIDKVKSDLLRDIQELFDISDKYNINMPLWSEFVVGINQLSITIEFSLDNDYQYLSEFFKILDFKSSVLNIKLHDIIKKTQIQHLDNSMSDDGILITLLYKSEPFSIDQISYNEYYVNSFLKRLNPDWVDITVENNEFNNRPCVILKLTHYLLNERIYNDIEGLLRSFESKGIKFYQVASLDSYRKYVIPL